MVLGSEAMPNKLENLSDDQLDTIRELASVGSGHSANALSELLGQKIQMQVPKVRVVPVEDVAYELLDSDALDVTVAALFVDTPDETPLELVSLFEGETIAYISGLIGNEEPSKDLFSLSEDEKSLVQEVGNILLLQFLTAIESLTGIEARPRETPRLIIDMAEAVLNAIMMRVGLENHSVLLVDNVLYTDRFEVKALSLLIPSEAFLELMFEKLLLDM